MTNDHADASAPNIVPLHLIWDHDGKRVIDSATGENLTARYGIETIIACEGDRIALRLAPGLGVETIDRRYAQLELAGSGADVKEMKVSRNRLIETLLMSWPCDLVAGFGVWLRSKQVDLIFNDAEARPNAESAARQTQPNNP